MTPTQTLVATLYRDASGEPINLSPLQDFIFRSIAQKLAPRLHIMCHTRFGKSLTAGLAVLTRAATYPEKWAIIAGTKPKAKIIMDYVISHIFDNDIIKSRFIPEKGDNVDDLRRYRNKNHVTFKTGLRQDPVTGKDMPLYGEVFIGSAVDALGFGAQNVVEDESALINDNDHSLVVRMLGDDLHNNFLCKIGNPFERNHFLTSYHDPNYKKIIADCYRGLQDGRITKEIIEENRPYSFFKILYECKFPSALEVDESGWMYLLTDDDVKTAVQRKLEKTGEKRMGLDVARSGRNYNAWVVRGGNYAEVVDKNLDDNLISTADHTVELARKHGVRPNNIFVDDSGVGGGVTDYLKSINFEINPVNFGERAEMSEEYLNVRAEVYGGKEGVASWLKQSGMLAPHKDWIELTRVRFKKDSAGRIKIEPKEEMRKRGVESPDVADALALTFAKNNKSSYHGIDPRFILDGGVKPFYPDMPG